LFAFLTAMPPIATKRLRQLLRSSGGDRDLDEVLRAGAAGLGDGAPSERLKGAVAALAARIDLAVASEPPSGGEGNQLLGAQWRKVRDEWRQLREKALAAAVIEGWVG
jgi:hypothetical protein